MLTCPRSGVEFLHGCGGPGGAHLPARDGDSMVVKADVPGIDPNKDVDITLAGDELRINVRHEETTEHKDKLAYRLKSGTAPSP